MTFEDWWKVYPKKNKKKPCREKWARMKLDDKADILINDVLRRIQMCPRWKAGFIPDPLTYLNQERWEDEIEEKEVVKERKCKICEQPRMGSCQGIDYCSTHLSQAFAGDI